MIPSFVLLKKPKTGQKKPKKAKKKAKKNNQNKMEGCRELGVANAFAPCLFAA
jgi:hypothetical protein